MGLGSKMHHQSLLFRDQWIGKIESRLKSKVKGHTHEGDNVGAWGPSFNRQRSARVQKVWDVKVKRDERMRLVLVEGLCDSADEKEEVG